MRRTILIAVAVAAAAVGVVAAAERISRPGEDQLGATLRRFGFRPLALPTEFMSVGSLYHVDPSVRFFHVICRASPDDLRGAVQVSRAPDFAESAFNDGRFATAVTVDVNWLLNGEARRTYKQTVRFALTDVQVEEIAADWNGEIFRKLLAKPSCDAAVKEALRAGGYVCQGQKVLKATAEFKLDRDVETGIATRTNATADVKQLVKMALETQSNQTVVERHGRLFAGSALKYGVEMKPTCMAPPEGRFTRVLPESVFGRATNFVLFRVIEPIWPREEEHATASLPAGARTQQ